MRRIFSLLIIWWLVVSLIDAAAGSPSRHEAARSAARVFGQALMRADVSLLRPLLPERGKVRMRLTCLGPEEGFYSASQVEALLFSFMRRGSVQSFELLRVEGDPQDYVMIHGRAQAKNREGRAKELDFHLTFQPEGERWVLREIREAPP